MSERDDTVVIEIDLTGHTGSEAVYSDEENDDNHVSSNEDDQIDSLNVMDYAGVIAEIDYGCYMKLKTGSAGEDPQKDSFPFFKSNKRWTCLMWVGNPSEWRLVNFEKDRPEDIYESDDPKASYTMISNITEVFLELAPSASFRIYQGNVVTKCTPIPEVREHAEAWVNAIFGSMQIQSSEHAEELDDLRDRYIESMQEEEGEEQGEDEDEGEEEAGAAAVVVNNDVEGDVDIESGVREKKRRDSAASHTTTKSAFVDFHAIYGWKAAPAAEKPPSNSCCVIC